MVDGYGYVVQTSRQTGGRTVPLTQARLGVSVVILGIAEGR